MPNKAKLVTRAASASTVTEDTLIKGSALTHAELDSDLINLRDQSIGIASDDSTVIDVGMGNTLKVAGGGTVTTSVSGQTLTITGSASAQGITFVGDDSTGTRISDNETIKIAGASGITTAVSGDTLTISGAQSVFQTIAVAGQNSVVADTTTDTLTLAAGSGVTITTNDATDTVTIAASASTGDLSITGTTISAETTNADITITSTGTGNLNVNMDTLRIGDSGSDATITTNGAGNLILTTNDSEANGASLNMGDTTSGNTRFTYADPADPVNTTFNIGRFRIGPTDGAGATRDWDTTIFSKGTSGTTLDRHRQAKTFSSVTLRTYDLPTATTRYHAHNFGSGVTLSGASNFGNTNSTYRCIQAESHVNLAGISPSYAGLDSSVNTFAGQAIGISGLTSTKNSTATAATSTEALTFNAFNQVGDQSASNADLADVTVTNSVNFAGYTSVQAATGRTTTVTNALGFVHTGSRVSGSGTKTITNEYGFRMLNNSQATNKYGIVIDNASYTNTLGGITLQNGALSTSDSTAIQIDEGLNVSGTLNAKIIVTNEISSEDSSAIQINEALNVSGALTTQGSTTFNSFYRDKINALTSSSTITVDANTAPTHKVTLSSNTAFVITNLPTGGNLTLIIVQDGTGSRTAAFGTDGSTAVKFAGGTGTLSTAASSIDIVNIYNDGTNYYGSLAKAFA